ncbi:hypothetical protein Tco_1254975 [Tanacetum coccineum]
MQYHGNLFIHWHSPLPPAPVAPSGQQVAPEILTAHTTWVKGSKDIAGAHAHETMDPEIQQNLEKTLLAYDMLTGRLKTLFAHKLMQELLHELREIFIYLQTGKNVITSPELLKKKKNVASGAGGLGIFAIELSTFLIRSWIYATSCGTHICNTTQGLRVSRKLKPGALSLYVGNGQREAVEAIGNNI